jgi:DNA repair ATPase RecN
MDREKFLVEAVNQVTEAEAVAEAYVTVTEDLVAVKALVKRVSIDTEELSPHIDTITNDRTSDLKEIPEQMGFIKRLTKKLDNTLLDQILRPLAAIEESESIVKGLESIQIDKSAIDRTFETCKVADEKLNNIEPDIKDLFEMSKAWDEVNDRYQVSKDRFHAEMERLGTCPLCGGKV